MCGLKDTGIQKQLLMKDKLTLAKAVEIAQGMEAAEKNAKRLQGGETTVCKLASRGEKTGIPAWKRDKPCYHCGGSGHAPSDCHFRDATCHKCQKKGHIAKVCMSSPWSRRQKPHQKPAIERKLDRLEEAGIIQQVAHSEWAAPVVPVPKGDGQIRLCDDYKVTINPELDVDQYPLPKPDELFAKLAGGKRFTKIDLTHAYQQMSLEESSRK